MAIKENGFETVWCWGVCDGGFDGMGLAGRMVMFEKVKWGGLDWEDWLDCLVRLIGGRRGERWMVFLGEVFGEFMNLRR